MIFFLSQVNLVLGQEVTQGFIDLSSNRFTDSRTVFLSGEWEFYWDKLLTTEALEKETNKTFIQVPGAWQRQGDYSTLGFATYHVKIKLTAGLPALVLYFPIINSAAKVWINGELSQQTGVVGTDAETHHAKLAGTFVSIPENTTMLDVVVQVSNFTYFSGGIAGPPQLQTSTATIAKQNRTNGIENFFAGSLIAMFIYQFILYFLYHRGKPYLWLSLICLGVALRSLIVHGGSFLLPTLFPEVEWEYWKKIEFGSVYAIVALFPLYVYHLFTAQAPKKPVIFFTAISALMVFTVVVTPQYVYGKILEVCHVGLLLAFIYTCYSITLAWRAKNEDAKIILFGVIASFPFILMEILKNSRFMAIEIGFMYLVEVGLLVFLLFQAYLLANHYAKSYKKLETINIDLEKTVKERTTELVAANTVKDKLLSVMSHDIKSPLNSLRGILQIHKLGTLTQEEFGHYTKLIESDLNKTNLLVENILYWTASQIKGVEVRKESVNLSMLVEENVQLLSTQAGNKNISVECEVIKDLLIVSDKNILNLVLRNLIANAIKFSKEGGLISISLLKENEALTIKVKDQGVGMNAATLEGIMRGHVVSAAGTANEKGTGLGLTLCRDYLQRAGGELTIESTEKKGSTFIVRLPL